MKIMCGVKVNNKKIITIDAYQMVLKFDTFKLLIHLIAVLKKNGNDTCFVYCICTLLIKITILIPMYQYNVKYCMDKSTIHKHFTIFYNGKI